MIWPPAKNPKRSPRVWGVLRAHPKFGLMASAPWRPMTRPAGREWTVEEAALFAARRDFELLRLLSTDQRALATARRLGYTTAAAAKMAGKPKQAATAGTVGGDDADGSIGDRNEKCRRKPRKPSAARRQVLNERFEQKRLKATLLMVLP